MKTYNLKAYRLAYSDGRGNYSTLVVIAESAEQAAAYYTVEQGVNVITCTETSWPEPEQPRGHVPLDWVAPAAEPETETAERAAEINSMCTDCIRCGSDCDGTTCETWTGCIYRETAAQRDIRLFDFYKRRLLALAGGEPLRWVCVQYLCSFPGLSPYDMGAELMAEGVEIIYDDTAITRAENAAERRRVQRAYAAREGVRA